MQLGAHRGVTATRSIKQAMRGARIIGTTTARTAGVAWKFVVPAVSSKSAKPRSSRRA